LGKRKYSSHNHIIWQHFMYFAAATLVREVLHLLRLYMVQHLILLGRWAVELLFNHKLSVLNLFWRESVPNLFACFHGMYTFLSTCFVLVHHLHQEAYNYF
jgi:hypothetical protein